MLTIFEMVKAIKEDLFFIESLNRPEHFISYVGIIKQKAAYRFSCDFNSAALFEKQHAQEFISENNAQSVIKIVPARQKAMEILKQRGFELGLSEKKKYEGYNAYIMYSDKMENTIKGIFFPEFEICFLSGEKRILPDGLILQLFNCNKEDENKIRNIIHSFRFGNNFFSNN